MTTLRATLLFAALVLTTNGALLVASQTNKSQAQSQPTSLFYEEQAEQKEDAAQLSQQAYAKLWLQATLGTKQQALAQQLAEITSLPKDVAKLIALYEYEFKGHCDMTLQAGNRRVDGLIVLSNGRLASRAYNDNWGSNLKIWNLTTGSCNLSLEDPWCCLIDLPDGRLALTPMDYTIKILNPSSGKYELTFGKQHTREISCLTALRDGKLASGSCENTVKIWNATSGAYEFDLKHTHAVNCLIVLPDGRLASGSADGSIKIWNLTSRKCELDLKHTHAVNCLIVLPDGRLASESVGGSIAFWNTATGECKHILTKQTYAICALTVLFDGRLISLSQDSTIKIWNTTSDKCELSFKVIFSSTPCDLTFLPDGRIVTGDEAGLIKIWS